MTGGPQATQKVGYGSIGGSIDSMQKNLARDQYAGKDLSDIWHDYSPFRLKGPPVPNDPNNTNKTWGTEVSQDL
jgi:hypothetical protein